MLFLSTLAATFLVVELPQLIRDLTGRQLNRIPF